MIRLLEWCFTWLYFFLFTLPNLHAYVLLLIANCLTFLYQYLQ